MKTIISAVALFVLGLAINQKCDPPGNAILSLSDNIQLNQACPANSHCLENGYCACDSGYIGGCTQKAFSMQNDKEVKATINSGGYTFFSVVGDSQQFTLLVFSLCHSSRSDNQQEIDVWGDNGLTDMFTKENAQPGGKSYSISEGCINLSTPFMKFGTKPNGETEAFIIGLKLTQSGQIQVKLTVDIQLLDFWGLMTKLLFIIGGVFFLTLSGVVAFIVYKWRRRHLFEANRLQNNSLSHFQQYMPKIKLKDLPKEKINEQLCSVCLLEMGEQCWVRVTVCGHVFHQDCLDQWCKSNLNCPICRKSFDAEKLKEECSILGSSNGSLRQSIL